MAHDNAEALNRFLDDLTYGPAIPEDDIDPDLLSTVRWFGDLGSEPRPDPEFRNRLEHDLMKKLAFVPATGLPASGPTPISTARHQKRLNWSASPFPARLPQQMWANTGLAAMLLLALLGVAYLAFGPLRPDPDQPNRIPAALGPSATPTDATATPTPTPAQMVPPTVVPPTATPADMPTATPIPASMVSQTVAGTWNWVRNGESNNVIFNADGSYLEYSPRDGVGLGGWQQTGDGTFVLVVVYQTPLEPLAREEIFASDYVPTGHAFQPGVIILRVTIQLDASGQTMTATGAAEQRDAAGNVTAVVDVEPQTLTRVSGTIPVETASGERGMLVVQMLDAMDGAAVGGTCLDLVGPVTVSVCDDSDGDVDSSPGVVEIDELPAGDYMVTVLPPAGYDDERNAQMVSVLPGELSSLSIMLHRTGDVPVEPTIPMPPTPPAAPGAVHVQVVAEDGITPIGGACLDLTGPATYSICDDSNLDADTTPGVIEAGDLAEGDYTVTLYPPSGYEPADGWGTVTIEQGQMATLTIALRSAGGNAAQPTPPRPMPTATPVS